MKQTWLFGWGLAFLMGCGGTTVPDRSSSGAKSGRLRVLLTDNPLDGLEEVNVVISRVDVIHESGRVSALLSDRRRVDLLRLRDGVTTLLGEVDLPEGSVTQLRFVVESADVVKEGTTHEMFVPSGAQTGLKLVGHVDIVAGTTTEILVDFDAEKSVHFNRGRGYMLKPVLSFEVIGISGEVNPWTIADDSIPLGRRDHPMVANDGRLYIFGGLNPGAATTDIQIGTINQETGQVQWQISTRTTPTTINGQSVNIWNDWVYMFGGDHPFTDRVDRAPILANGDIGPWESQPHLLSGWHLTHESVVVDGVVFVVGGSDSNSPRSDVQCGRIDEDGNIASWQMTASLNSARAFVGVVSDGRFVYAIGGLTDGKRFLRTVEYAEIDPNGCLHGWQETEPFATPRVNHAAVRKGRYVYLLGGQTEGGSTADVQFAELLADGGLGPWSTTEPFHRARANHAAAVAAGRIYISGGEDRGTLSDVQFADSPLLRVGSR